MPTFFLSVEESGTSQSEAHHSISRVETRLGNYVAYSTIYLHCIHRNGQKNLKELRSLIEAGHPVYLLEIISRHMPNLVLAEKVRCSKALQKRQFRETLNRGHMTIV